MQNEYNEENSSSQQEFKPFLEVIFPAIRILLFTDFLIKIIVTSAYLLEYLNLWLFIGALLIPSIALSQWAKHRNRTYIRKLSQTIPAQDLFPFWTIKLKTDLQSLAITIYGISGFLLFFIIAMKWVHPIHWYGYVAVSLIAIMGSSLFNILAQSSLIPYAFDPVSFQAFEYWTSELKKINVSHRFGLALTNIERHFGKRGSVDEVDFNDFEIARLDSDLKDISGRVDSYMLESVLLGALTFSGFLSIIVSDKWTSLNGLFERGLSGFVNSIQQINATTFNSLITSMALPENLFRLLLAETLLCSLFFVLILGLRMRFTHLLVKANYLLEVLKALNNKEEDLFGLEMSGIKNDSLVQRRIRISKKISETIEHTSLMVQNIRPLERIMGVYRNLGLILFFIILVTSGLFFSPATSAFIIVLALFTWLYRIVETEVKRYHISTLLSQHRKDEIRNAKK